MAMTVVDKDCTEKAEDFTDHLLNMGYTKGMKDGYAKAIEEFSERFEKICDKPLCDRCNDFSDCSYCLREGIKEIAKELKGE